MVFTGFRHLRALGTPFLRSMSEKPNVVFVLGGPGAGKGTQCENIVQTFGWRHLSAGDLLREERKRPDSKYGGLIESCMREGKIVPVEITCSLLENAMNQSQAKNFLIDGFPRNEDNLSGWIKQVGEKVEVKFVLLFDCPDDVCLSRCLSRGAAGSGRVDDNEESLKKRLVGYHRDTMPIIKYYKEQGKVQNVDASRSAQDVFEEVKKLFA